MVFEVNLGSWALELGARAPRASWSSLPGASVTMISRCCRAWLSSAERVRGPQQRMKMIGQRNRPVLRKKHIRLTRNYSGAISALT